ncbi:hypothetical protein RND71_016066 [Anisodus tanguticus]|uniref:Uncharacterized protein n=1 Tax=Anisodus tanguticus TaxID=243964 RepID=A0AAE1S6Q2_9SOLA|nr:hypothetical protein RND71_016066 [Anisodus tanguticus]
MVLQFRPFSYLLLLVFIFSSSASVYSTDMGVGHAKLDTSHVHDTHQGWQWRSWMNHGSFRGPRKHLMNPTVKHNSFDVPKLPL